jgi:hypothetical protein
MGAAIAGGWKILAEPSRHFAALRAVAVFSRISVALCDGSGIRPLRVHAHPCDGRYAVDSAVFARTRLASPPTAPWPCAATHANQTSAWPVHGSFQTEVCVRRNQCTRTRSTVHCHPTDALLRRAGPSQRDGADDAGTTHPHHADDAQCDVHSLMCRPSRADDEKLISLAAMTAAAARITVSKELAEAVRGALCSSLSGFVHLRSLSARMDSQART